MSETRLKKAQTETEILIPRFMRASQMMDSIKPLLTEDGSTHIFSRSSGGGEARDVLIRRRTGGSMS